MLSPSRFFLAGGIVALAFALVLVVPVMLAGRGSNGAAIPAGPSVGIAASDFVLTDAVTGKQVSLASLRGKPVWLNFWASWCEGCKDEMPLIEKLYAKYRNEGLQVVGVNVQEKPDTVRDFISSNGFGWTFLLDSDGRVTDLYFVNGLPYQVFVGPDGVIKALYPGVLDEKRMDEYVGQLLK